MRVLKQFLEGIRFGHLMGGLRHKGNRGIPGGMKDGADHLKSAFFHRRWRKPFVGAITDLLASLPTHPVPVGGEANGF